MAGLLGLSIFAAAAPASAGGSWFDTVQPSHEPGDSVTVVGYTGGGTQGWVEDGPFFGWLTGNSGFTDADIGNDPSLRWFLGPLEIHETGIGGYTSLRVSMSFDLPTDLEPGVYGFNYCNHDCTEQIGDLIGGTVYIGVEPDARNLNWPAWEPEIANLPDDSVLNSASTPVFTAAAARAAGWPGPVDLTLVGTTPERGSEPTDLSAMWWSGEYVDEPISVAEPTSTTERAESATTTAAAPTSTLPDIITTRPPTPPDEPLDPGNQSPKRSRIAMVAIAGGAIGLVALTARRHPH